MTYVEPIRRSMMKYFAKIVMIGLMPLINLAYMFDWALNTSLALVFLFDKKGGESNRD